AYSYIDQLEKQYREFGLISVKLFLVSFVAITKPSLIKKFFENYNTFSKQNFILKKGELFIPDTLLVASPRLWRLKRKFYSPIFTSVNLRKYESIINRETKYLLSQIDSLVENCFDIRHVIDQHVCLTTIDALTGIYSREFLWNEIDKVLDFIHSAQAAATKRITRPFIWLDYIYYRTKEGKRIQAKVDYFYKTFEALQNKEVIGNNNEIYSLVDQINKLREFDKSISGKTQILELLAFLIAGYETSAFTITAALFYMGNYKNFLFHIL
ncbi:cytochrome P450 monooxygenase-like protein, partial [Leptotrombidium deliense]